MEFVVTRTSDEESREELINLNTLEELMEFIRKQGVEIIISISEDFEEPVNEIEIYDDYRE